MKPANSIQWMRTAPYDEIASHLCEVLCELDPVTYGNTLIAWQDRIDEDEGGTQNNGPMQRLLDMWSDQPIDKNECSSVELTYPGSNRAAEAQEILNRKLLKT